MGAGSQRAKYTVVVVVEFLLFVNLYIPIPIFRCMFHQRTFRLILAVKPMITFVYVFDYDHMK